MGENFDQKACVPITKRHEFIGQVLENEQVIRPPEVFYRMLF
jgi:hypothetical protein